MCNVQISSLNKNNIYKQSDLEKVSTCKFVTPPGLPLITGPVCGFQGQDLEV